MDALPRLYFDSLLKDQNRVTLAHYERSAGVAEVRGSYGILQKYRRRVQGQGQVQEVMIKRPKFTETSPSAFYHEALLQTHIHETLTVAGRAAAAAVFDIFIENEKVCFSMEYIDGVNCLAFCLAQTHFEKRWLQLLFQLSLLLTFLQKSVCFDHRDLKYNNVWIRSKPVHFTMMDWEFKCPFEVVILDFGFACLGDGNRNTVVNLGEGVFDTGDKCPKEGRDLFQFILSFWSEPAFRGRVPSGLRGWIEGILSSEYTNLAGRLNSFDWSYLLTHEVDFSQPQLEPEAVMEKIQKYLPVAITPL